MSTEHDTHHAPAGSPERNPETLRRLAELSAASAAVMDLIAKELEGRAPPPASQSAHALWIGALVAVLYLAGSRGIGADEPLVSLLSVGVAGGLVFGVTWFQDRAQKRGHGLGRKEMARTIAKQLGEERVRGAREWVKRA
jgi:hypothetical protein